MLSAEPGLHTSRARNGGTVPRLRKARANEHGSNIRKCKMSLSRSHFWHGETSGNASKLTKISCDIAATPAAEPLEARPPRTLSSIVPARHLTTSSVGANENPSSCRDFLRLSTLSTRLEREPLARGKNCSLDRSSRAYRFVLLRDLSHFLLAISHRAPRHTGSDPASTEYRCWDRSFSWFRRSAKAFPFGLPSTTFSPTRSTPLVAISLT